MKISRFQDFTDRILDLSGKVKAEGQQPRELIEDPIEYLKADYDIQVKGVEFLRQCMATLTDDPITYDLLKAYLADEEEDQFWSENQLELIEKLGNLPWLIKHM
ncbi:MAG: hypothetical protein IKN91_09470 [Paludibacteraceae bacterium]|nr:hypothetical protein [Paludibacteraceae bacterium]